MIIDTVLPHFHFSESHSLPMPVPLDLARRATKDVSLREMSWVVGALLAIRMLPAKLMGKPVEDDASEPLLQSMLRDHFVLLADEPEEIVLGMAGQFWHIADPEPVHLANAQAFAQFNRPGYAKVAFNLVFSSHDDVTTVSTQTRIWTPDLRTRIMFGLYWGLIRTGSSIIRALWLRAIRRKAVARLRADIASSVA